MSGLSPPQALPLVVDISVLRGPLHGLLEKQRAAQKLNIKIDIFHSLWLKV